MSQFGKFRLLEQIGGGRLSQVFRVTRADLEGQLSCSPLIALKRVQPAVIGEPAFVQLVVREAGLLARLSHLNLCQCHEMGVVDGCAFFTLDLVQGCTLRALMRRTSAMGLCVPPSSVGAIGHQLARALAFLHDGCDAPLIHLDLSPQNVMLDLEGALKLIDFGIARYLDGRDPPPLGGKIAGTVGYMSPEQARGAALDRRADQFGLGILLWEMLAGRRAFRGNTPQTWDRLRAGVIPELEDGLATTPAPLAEVVRRLLEPSPARRFPHMEDVRRSLDATSSHPLAQLVQHLMGDPTFDPYDVVQRDGVPPPGAPDIVDIPLGEAGLEADYAELSIAVDHGEGTPGSLIRATMTSTGAGQTPRSPFLETIPEARATAHIAR